jgi:integrase
VDDTETEASNNSVPVISELAKRLNSYRATLGKNLRPDTPIFAAGNGKPLRLNNVLRGCILAALNRCEECRESEVDHDDVNAGHKYKRDESLPAWRGWHAFRRGLATNLHDLGIDDHTIKDILRHSSVTVTQRSYIKSLPKQSVAAMRVFDSSVAELVHKRDIELTYNGEQLVN